MLSKLRFTGTLRRTQGRMDGGGGREGGSGEESVEAGSGLAWPGLAGRGQGKGRAKAGSGPTAKGKQAVLGCSRPSRYFHPIWKALH